MWYSHPKHDWKGKGEAPVLKYNWTWTVDEFLQSLSAAVAEDVAFRIALGQNFNLLPTESYYPHVKSGITCVRDALKAHHRAKASVVISSSSDDDRHDSDYVPSRSVSSSSSSSRVPTRSIADQIIVDQANALAEFRAKRRRVSRVIPSPDCRQHTPCSPLSDDLCFACLGEE